MTDDTTTKKPWKDTREIHVRTEPERMWRAWAEPAGISGWFADDARGSAEPGGEIVHIWKDFGMEVTHKVVAADKPRYLALEGIAPTGVPFLQEIHIEKDGDVTVLRVVHSGFDGDADWDWEYEGVDSGWWMAFGVLTWYLENHDGKPRSSMASMQPTSLEPKDLYRRFTRRDELADWLGTTDRDLTEAGESVTIDMTGAPALNGSVLAATGSELALSWPELSAVIEFKTFPAGDQRLAGIRCHCWAEDQSTVRELNNWCTKATLRLLAT